MTNFTGVLAVHPSEDAAGVIPSGQGKTDAGVTVTIDVTGNHLHLQRLTNLFRPQHYRHMFSASSVAGSDVTPNDRIDFFDSYSEGWLNGAAVRVCRIVSDAWVEVGTGTITATVCRPTGKIMSSSAVMVPAGTQAFRWSPPSYHEPSVTEYFSVASVNSTTGDRSAWATPVSGTTDAAPASQTVSPANTETAVAYSGNVDGGLAAPTGLSVTTEDTGKTFAITWTDEPAADGVLVRRSQYSEFDDANYFTVSGVTVQAGDVLFVSKDFDHTTTRASVLSSRIYNSTESNNWGPIGPLTFSGEVANLTFAFMDESGVPFLRIVKTDAGSYDVGTYTHGGEDQVFYPNLEHGVSYRVRVAARSSTPDALSILMNGTDTSTGTPTLTSSWATYDHDSVTAAGIASNAQKTSILVNGPCTVDIALIQIYDARYDPFVLDPRDKTILGVPNYIRYHATAKTDPWSYDLERVTDRWTPNRNYQYTFPVALEMSKDVGCGAWLQVAPHFSSTEILGLVEYLAAPAGSGSWAAKRVAQGRTAPWTDDVPIRFGLGNELWNTILEFYTLPAVSGYGQAAVNAILLNFFIATVKSSPYYDASKFEFAMSGWFNFPSWNETAIGYLEHDCWFNVAPYISGGDSGNTTFYDPANQDDWDNLLAGTYTISRQTRFGDLRALADARENAAGITIRTGGYEGGPGYYITGVSNADLESQSEIMKSVGAGTVYLNQLCLEASNGVEEHNFFTFGNGNGAQNWASHSPWYEGYKANAPFQWMEFFRTYLKGGYFKRANLVLNGSITTSESTGATTVDAYQVVKGASTYYVITNNDTAASHDVRLVIPEGSAVTRYYMTGTNYKSQNIRTLTKEDVAITSEAVVSPSFPLIVTIPAGMAEVYEVV